MEKLLSFLKSKKDSHKILKIILLFVIGILIALIPTVLTILIGILISVISIIMLYFQVINTIGNKTGKLRIISFGLIASVFAVLLIMSLKKDVPFLLEKLSETANIDQYVVTTITEIKDNNATLNGIVNNIPTEFIMEGIGENYKINDQINVYINSKNLKEYTFMPPTFLNMAYLGLFFLTDGTLFGAMFVPIKRIYRIFKPKEVKDEEPKVKVKT